MRPPQRSKIHSPQFFLRHQVNHRNRIAGCLLAVIANKGELPVRGHGDFMRAFTHAHARGDFSGRGIYNGQCPIRFVQNQQCRGRSFRGDYRHGKHGTNYTNFDKCHSAIFSRIEIFGCTIIYLTR